MAEVLAMRAALFALPFVIWFCWRSWSRATGRPMGSTPWPWLIAAGAVLVGISLMATAIFHRDNRGKVYVPAEVTPSGTVIRGHYEERAAPGK